MLSAITFTTGSDAFGTTCRQTRRRRERPRSAALRTNGAPATSRTFARTIRAMYGVSTVASVSTGRMYALIRSNPPSNAAALDSIGSTSAWTAKSIRNAIPTTNSGSEFTSRATMLTIRSLGRPARSAAKTPIA